MPSYNNSCKAVYYEQRIINSNTFSSGPSFSIPDVPLEVTNNQMVTFKDPDNINQEDYNNKVEDVSKKSEQNNIRLGALSTLLRKQDNFL